MTSTLPRYATDIAVTNPDPANVDYRGLDNADSAVVELIVTDDDGNIGMGVRFEVSTDELVERGAAAAREIAARAGDVAAYLETQLAHSALAALIATDPGLPADVAEAVHGVLTGHGDDQAAAAALAALDEYTVTVDAGDEWYAHHGRVVDALLPLTPRLPDDEPAGDDTAPLDPDLDQALDEVGECTPIFAAAARGVLTGAVSLGRGTLLEALNRLVLPRDTRPAGDTIAAALGGLVDEDQAVAR